MKKKKILILIPARYKSSRFEGKPLALIQGRPMIEWVYTNCLKLERKDPENYYFHCAVVTDDLRIEDVVHSFGGNCLMVADDVPSGTERISLAYQRFFDDSFDLVINVQGDEPLIQENLLFDLVDFHLHSDYQVATVVSPHNTKEEGQDFFNPNIVKVIFDKESGACHYFSRAAIPYERDNGGKVAPAVWHHHIGIYSYRPDALLKFCRAPVGYYEDLEKLEQLRAFELGFKIGAIETKLKLIGIDVKEDIDKLKEVLSEAKDTK